MEFSTQRIATPVSANTASHMEAIPMRPKIMTRAFTARANTTFWLEIAPVLLAIRMASGMASMLDVMKTTSAASMAASAPHCASVLRTELLQDLELISREKLCVYIVNADLGGYRLSRCLAVAGEHC